MSIGVEDDRFEQVIMYLHSYWTFHMTNVSYQGHLGENHIGTSSHVYISVQF